MALRIDADACLGRANRLAALGARRVGDADRVHAACRLVGERVHGREDKGEARGERCGEEREAVEPGDCRGMEEGQELASPIKAPEIHTQRPPTQPTATSPSPSSRTPAVEHVVSRHEDGRPPRVLGVELLQLRRGQRTGEAGGRVRVFGGRR